MKLNKYTYHHIKHVLLIVVDCEILHSFPCPVDFSDDLKMLIYLLIARSYGSFVVVYFGSHNSVMKKRTNIFIVWSQVLFLITLECYINGGNWVLYLPFSDSEFRVKTRREAWAEGKGRILMLGGFRAQLVILAWNTSNRPKHPWYSVKDRIACQLKNSKGKSLHVCFINRMLRNE